MSWSVANPWMLLGLLGVAIPVVIHLLNRRRAVVVDWGAMQFLEIGRRARRKLQITDLLLLAGRMLLLGLVALALARPFWTPTPAGADVGANGGGGAGGGGSQTARRDVVLILDGSDSMARTVGGTTPHDQAVAWARDVLGRLAPGSTVGVLLARDRVDAAGRSADARPRRGSTRSCARPRRRGGRATCRRRSPRRCDGSKGPRTRPATSSS